MLAQSGYARTENSSLPDRDGRCPDGTRKNCRPIADGGRESAFGVGEGLYLAHAGASRAEAERLVLSCLAKSRLPEPLRVAHLIGQAIVLRESRGRV